MLANVTRVISCNCLDFNWLSPVFQTSHWLCSSMKGRNMVIRLILFLGRCTIGKGKAIALLKRGDGVLGAAAELWQSCAQSIVTASQQFHRECVCMLSTTSVCGEFVMEAVKACPMSRRILEIMLVFVDGVGKTQERAPEDALLHVTAQPGS